MADKPNSMLAQPVNKGGLVEVLSALLEERSRDIHTGIQAKVLEVDYEKCLVTVQPLIRTMRNPLNPIEANYPIIHEVPVFFNSAQRGKARMSLPMQVGDVGELRFGERSSRNYLNSDGNSIQDSKEFVGVGYTGNPYPLAFYPEVFTASSARPFSKDSVVVEFDKAFTSLKASGEILSKNDNITSVLNPDGSGKISNGGGYIELKADGTVDINGFIIQPNGAASSPVSVQAPTVSAANSLTVAGKEMNQHKHLDGTYVAGSTDVTGISGEPV